MAIVGYYSALRQARASVASIAVVLNVLFIKITSKNSINLNKNVMRDTGSYAGVAAAGIDMIEAIKASGAEREYFGKLAGYQAKLNHSSNALKERSLFLNSIPELLMNICNAIILILGINNIFQGEFTIGILLAFQGFLSLFLSPVNELVRAFEDIQKTTGKVERIEDVINYVKDVDIQMDQKQYISSDQKRLSGNIELKNVTFGYNPLANPLVRDFNLLILKGEVVAVVGGSGSGKSTVANLISGLYEIGSGKILYDTYEKKQIDRYVFVNSLSIVDQTITLFGDTVRNNITLWDEKIEEHTIVEACKDACIYDEIMERTEGLDYMLLEGGENFSGGQRQRIEIARALARNPSIIILDEATSALDPITEEKIVQAIKRRGITCIMIAHRLSTVRDADKIIVLEKGKIMEYGTHSHLVMKEEGIYKELMKNE